MNVDVYSLHIGLLRDDFETIRLMVAEALARHTGAMADAAGAKRGLIDGALRRHRRHSYRLHNTYAAPDTTVLLFLLMRAGQECDQPAKGPTVEVLLREAQRILGQLLLWLINIEADGCLAIDMRSTQDSSERC